MFFSSICCVVSARPTPVEDHKSKKTKKTLFVSLKTIRQIEQVIMSWSIGVSIPKSLVSTYQSYAIQTTTSQIFYSPEFGSRPFLVDPVTGFNALVLKSENDKQSLIGKGSSKEVYPGIDVFNGEKYAVGLLKKEGPKVCLKIEVSDENAEEPLVTLKIDVLEHFTPKKTSLHEAEILEKVNHSKHVIHFKNFFSRIFEPFDFLVTDLYSRQDLFKRVFLDQKPLSIHENRIVTRDCIKGLLDIHEVGIIHQDLKPEAIFFLVTANTNLIAKAVIGDFGLAIKKSEPLRSCYCFCGTWRYLSPERCKMVQKNSTSKWIASGEKSDVWSMGVTLYELWRRKRFIKDPVTKESIHSIVEKLTDPLILSSINSSQTISAEIKPLLIGMLKINPEERWSARQARDYISSLA